MVKDWTSLYASSEERLNLEEFQALVQEDNRLETNAIEIGHLFYFSTKYSDPLGADVVNEDVSIKLEATPQPYRVLVK